MFHCCVVKLEVITATCVAHLDLQILKSQHLGDGCIGYETDDPILIYNLTIQDVSIARPSASCSTLLSRMGHHKLLYCLYVCGRNTLNCLCPLNFIISAFCRGRAYSCLRWCFPYSIRCNGIRENFCGDEMRCSKLPSMTSRRCWYGDRNFIL